MTKQLSLYALVLGLIFVPALAFSEGAGENFAEHKSHVLQDLDQRIADLQKAKGCISTAQDQAGIKSCRQQLEEARKQERAQHMDRRIQHMQERKQKMMERK